MSILAVERGISSSSSASSAAVAQPKPMQAYVVAKIAEVLGESLPVAELHPHIAGYVPHPVCDLLQTAVTNDELRQIASRYAMVPETRIAVSGSKDENGKFHLGRSTNSLTMPCEEGESLSVETVIQLMEAFPLTEELDLQETSLTQEELPPALILQKCPNLKKIWLQYTYERFGSNDIFSEDLRRITSSAFLEAGVQVFLTFSFISMFVSYYPLSGGHLQYPIVKKVVKTGSWLPEDLPRLFDASQKQNGEPLQQLFRELLASLHCDINAHKKYQEPLLHHVCWKMKKREDLEPLFAHANLDVNSESHISPPQRALDIIHIRLNNDRNHKILPELEAAKEMLLARGAMRAQLPKVDPQEQENLRVDDIVKTLIHLLPAQGKKRKLDELLATIAGRVIKKLEL